MDSFRSIPIIDIGDINETGGSKIDSLVKKLKKTYGEIGFAYIVNHNIDPYLIEDLFKNHTNSTPCPMKRK